jgi:glutathione S-transferase
MPRLFHLPGSRSNRVLWMLEEIGAPYELTVMERDDRSTPEHRERHPLGRVPALQLDDGTFMFESIAICLHLADANPDAALIGALGSTPRALAYQWSVFALAEIEAPLIAMLNASRAGHDVAPAQERFGLAAAALADALGDGEWLVEDRFSVADLIGASVLGLAHSRGLMSDMPVASAFVERGRARPAYERAQAAGTATAV